MENVKLQVGDRVSFDLQGPKGKVGQGFGTVTRVVNGQALINPNYPMNGSMRMVNIQKVAPKQ